ncbi:MAG: oligoendopeptidase F, partial [Hyphomicrobiales bacterium]|nr:oligoendopeptidase F [Hyphomicrobiales bacterium]
MKTSEEIRALGNCTPPQAPDGANTGSGDLGAMPEWNLDDLYPAPDSKTLKRDLARANDDAAAFQQRYQGKLDALAKADGAGGALAGALRDYEALQDLIGRITSFAGLLYAADTSDPERAKFYGDIQEKLTGITTQLLFFGLEFNRLDDAELEAALNDDGLAHYRPWIEDLRKEKPYQLDDKIEQLFHEKSVTGRGAWNRLFNETITALRFEIDGEPLSLEPALNKLLSPEADVRRSAADAM